MEAMNTHHAEWYDALFMVGTNLVALMPIILAFRLGLWYIGVQITLSMVFSTIYHACDATGFCLFGYPLIVWRTMDYIYAFMQIVIVFIFLVDFESSESSPTAFMYQRWAVITQQLFGAVVILVILVDPFSQAAAYVIVAMGGSIIYIKFVFLDRGRTPFKDRFEVKFLVVGFALFGLGVGLFGINGTPVYWLFHSTWHVCAYLGQYFLILGGSKHYKGWKEYAQRHCFFARTAPPSDCRQTCFGEKQFEEYYV